MKEFKTLNQTFIKSENSTKKIWKRYAISLLFYIIPILIYFLITNKTNLLLNLIKSIFISITISIVIQYLINIIKKEHSFKKIFEEDNIIQISLILGFFLQNETILISLLTILITLIIKNSIKNINLSSVLYGLLFIKLYHLYQQDLITPLTNLKELNYTGTYQEIVSGGIISQLIGSNYYYLSPIISIIVFIYLFHKKSIKYNVVISYILTIFMIMLIYGLFNNMSIWYVFFQITTGNILFLSIYCLSDYGITPVIGKSQITYGTILGILTVILRFIAPEFSVIIVLILGPLFLTKILDKIYQK